MRFNNWWSSAGAADERSTFAWKLMMKSNTERKKQQESSSGLEDLRPSVRVKLSLSHIHTAVLQRNGFVAVTDCDLEYKDWWLEQSNNNKTPLHQISVAGQRREVQSFRFWCDFGKDLPLRASPQAKQLNWEDLVPREQWWRVTHGCCFLQQELKSLQCFITTAFS